MSQEETEQIGAFPAEDLTLHPCVMVLSGDSTGRTFRLDKTTSVIGRGDDADIVLKDRGISRQHAKFTVAPDGQVIFSDLGSTNGSFLGTKRIDSTRLTGGERLQLGASVKLKFDFRDPEEEQLLEGAARDPLTGALNRGYFDQRLQEACAKSKRYGSTLACAFIDADHFKLFNDNHGHAAGDEVLKELVRRVSALKRQEDTFARYGGEEFVLLLPETSGPGAQQLMERVRRAVGDRPFSVDTPSGPKELRVTVSIGVSAKCGDFLANELVEEADQALYQAKAEGRNQVKVAF